MKRLSVLVFIFFFALSGMAYASPIQWKIEDGGNDHWYQLIEIYNTWHDSKIYSEISEGT